MEDAGEGLVAIVQGLDPAGVTLTVCNRSRHNSDRRRSSRPRIQINAANTRPDIPATDQRSHTLNANAATLANQRSSVETSTGTDLSRQHTSSQICDGRYASSYKLAHCMVTPTSPPVAVSEFPPQRSEPCRSSSHRYCKSTRETEAFAHSLRKYPSMAPFRTASTDLIEKLIRYTQAKNFEEMSRSAKSMRSLRQQKPSDTYNELARASKHQQTYTRRQDDNVVNNSHVQLGYSGRKRNFSKNLKKNRHRESSSYDYLKATTSPYGRSNRSDESPSPLGSSSPERAKSPEKCKSPERCRSPEVSRSPFRFKSINGFRSPGRPNRPERSIRFERSVRDLSLSEMSQYIRSTIRQMCNERPVVYQVCPELKNRFNQHKKVCPNKNDRDSNVMDDELEEDQASGSVLSRLFKSFSRCAIPSTQQAGCQCTRTDCYCTKATQCVNNPDASTNTTACSCKTPTKTSCCRGMPCVCANKAQDQTYYKKRIDEEISEWLKDVPVHSIEGSDSKKKRETVIKKLRKVIKQLPDDENFDDNARNEIKSFVDDFPLWNPGKDKKDENLFKNHLTDKLTERILSVPRKPDRFRDIVKKWIVNIDFEDDGEELDKKTIIDKFVNELKTLAADRPACDIKYTHILRKKIIELLLELALKFDGDMVMLKKMANKLATEIVSIPRNVNLSGDTNDLTNEFEENVSDWICEHGFCAELKKDPKLIEGLAKKLNKLKFHGIDDERVVEKMKAEIHQFVDDVGIAIETVDELIDELIKQLSNTVQTDEMERLNRDELTKVLIDWLRSLPGSSDLHPRKLEKIIKELVKVITEGREQGNEDLTNDIFNYLVDADVSIDSADLGWIMEELNILPSNKYHKEQVKKAMMQDIFDVIENMPVPQDRKAELRNKAHEIVENHLNKSSLNSKEAHDDVKEAIIDDMDDVISSIDMPKESRLKLKTSLSSVFNKNFDKSFTSLSRLNRDGSNLKQAIAKDIRNAVWELPIDTDKKKNLMQEVKGTLSKNMHKPLPFNVKITIKDEISDIVERCPISEDNSIVGSLKKMLSAVASKHLNICLPKCVCDIQRKVEKDIGIVIDRSSIGMGEKKELKKGIQDILTENEERRLSDEVLRTIKKDINGVVSDLSIPQVKKDVLKKTFGETISKGFNEALPNLRHDLNKIRNKLFEDICNAIEKSQIPGVVKIHLINKLKFMLARNLGSSLSDEEKHTIINDVSNIVKNDMPEEKRKSLTNKLAKNLDTQHRQEDTNEIDQLTKNLKELENKALEHILREMVQAVEEAPIPKEKKIYLKKKIKDMASKDYNKPAEDIAEALRYGINEIIDELHLHKDKKNELENELAAAIDEYTKLLRKIKDVETKYLQTKTKSSADAISKYKKIGKGLIKEFNEKKAKESILQGIEDIIEESAIPEEKKVELKRKLIKMTADNLKKLFSDVQDVMKIGMADVLDELEIPKSEKDKLKSTLINMVDENLDNLRDVDKTKAKENIWQGIEKIIEESTIPEEKKMESKRKLKKIATDNLKKPFSDDIQDAIKIGIADILDEQQIPKSEKNKLKRALTKMTDSYLENLRKEKQPVEKVDERKATENIFQGIEKIIEESAIPEAKKMELKRKFKKMAIDNLKKPFNDDVHDAIKIGIADILDEMLISKSEKDKLQRALTNMADENLYNLQDIDKTNAKKNILQGIEKTIEESAISEQKKMDLKRKLKKMTTDNLKKPFSDDVQDAIKIGIADILDELQIPKSEEDKLKSALLNMADENLDNLGNVDKTNAKESIMQGIEKKIEESAIPEEKKTDLKRKLKKITTDNLKKPFSDDVQDAIKIGITDILDELQLPKSEKDQLKRALINIADDNLDNLRDVDKTNAKESIMQGIEKKIEESAIPEEKKTDFKSKLKKITTDNLKKPFSDDVQDAIKIGIADILDELQIPKSEKDKLKSALLNMADNNLDHLGDVDKTNAKESIMQGIEKTMKESAIPEGEEQKMDLKRTLKKITTDNLKKPFSDDTQGTIKIGISDIEDELQIPKCEKDKLKSALINIADDNLDNLRDVDKTNAKESIMQGIEKTIEESTIPEEIKMELKRKLKKMTTDNFKKPFSDDTQETIKIGIADIVDELHIPHAVKNKLKRALLNITDNYFDSLRKSKKPVEKGEEQKTKENIMQGIRKTIEESAIPEEKKMDLKRKLIKMTSDNLKKPFSDDVQDAIKIGIAEMLDDFRIPKSDKVKLKRALTNMADENLNNLRDLDKTKAKERTLQGIEKIIKESAIPEEKKMELKRKLKKMATDNLGKPFSDDVQDAIKIGIADILDELQIPKSENDQLKRALINMADDNLDNLRDVCKTNTKESILQEIEKTIEESDIPEKQKTDLKRKLKEITTDNLKKPFSYDEQDATKIGIADIVDKLQIPTSEKSKLQRALTKMTDSYLDNLREARQPVEVVDERKATKNILQGIENISDESAIPEEKKMELNRKLKKMTTDNLEKPFSDDVKDPIKIGIADILDELEIPKSKKDQLKRALINMADDNMYNLRDVDKTKAKESILQGIEKIIEESAIPEEKKMESKRKLKKMATDNLKQAFSDDVQDSKKIDIADILDELQIPKLEKSKLKRALTKISDSHLDNLREAKQRVKKVDENKATENILQGIEKIIEESAIPEDKKMELKRKLKKMATNYLKKPFKDDVHDAIKISIADILDELQIPKSDKDQLKRALINITDDNLDNLRDVDKTYAKESILQGIEKSIEESAIPEEKKMELKRKLKKTITENFKKPFSDDVQDAIKIGIADIIDEQQIPKPEKNKLKHALTKIIDNYLDNLRKAKQPTEKKYERQAKENILQGIEKIIEESAIPEENKMELKTKLKKMTTDNLKKPFSDDVPDEIKIGIADILDELQIPKSEKNELKRALLKTVDESVDNLRGFAPKLSSQVNDFKDLESETQNSILLEFEKAIDKAPIPMEKKKELKKKLKEIATKNFQKSLFDDTSEALKYGIYEILDELNLPKDKKNKLQSQLTAAVDVNLSNFKKSMSDVNRNKLNDIIRRVLPQFDEAVDPSYQKQLAEEFDKLLEIALTDGDFKDARKKLIKKLMRKQNLSEKEASAPVNELIARAREMALREDIRDEKYELDPSYVKTLEADMKDLVNIALFGGDFEDARRKLTKKLMREQNLPEEEASGFVDELIGKAQKLALAAQSKDKFLFHKESFAKAINNAVEQSTMSKLYKNRLKNNLLSKIKQAVDESAHINDTEALKAEVLKDCENLVDASSIPIGKTDEFKFLLKEEIMDDYDDEETFAMEEIPVYEDAISKYKEAFARAINDAVDESTLSKPDKSSQKNELLSKLNQTVHNSPHLNDISALVAVVLKDSIKVVNVSSIPIDKKNELKLLLQEAMAKTSKELMDDEEVSREAFAMFKDKLTETVKTWMDSLPVDLDPKIATAVAKNLVSDILDRHKYLQVHSEAVSTDKDEIETLKYQIFRRIKNLVDLKDIPPIMEGTEELYRMIMEIEPPSGFLKLRREQSIPERRRRDPVPQDRKKSTSTALVTSYINYSLKELIGTSKNLRKQWSRNLDDAITKSPLPKNEKNIMKETLAIYDETCQIHMLSTKSGAKEETSTIQGTKSKKHVPPKPQKNNNKEKPSSRLSKIEKALTFNNTTNQKSPFTPNSNKVVDEKDFTKFANDTIKAWLKKVRVNIEPDAKNKIIEGLTHDVVDRKKYLQVFGGAEPSQSDELEYMKLQVHRRLSGFVPAEAMKAVITDTKQLLAKIGTVKMKVTPENSKSQKSNKKQKIADISDSREKATNTSMNGDEEEMEQELSNMEFIPGQTSTPRKPGEEKKEPTADKYKTKVAEPTAVGYKTKVAEPTAEKYKTKVVEPTAVGYKTKVAGPTVEEYKTKIAEPTSEEYKTKVAEYIITWIDSMPIDLEPEAKTDFIDELANDIVDRNKYLEEQPDRTFSNKEEIENLRFQVFKRLRKADLDACVTPDIKKIEELYKMIGSGRRKSLTPKQAEEFKTALNEEISAILDDYNICCDRRELHPSLANELRKLGQSNADQDEIVENLIETIKRLTYLSTCVCDEEAEELAHKLLYRTKKLIARIKERNRQKEAITPVKKIDFKDAMMKDIGDVFSGCPMSEEKRRLMESQLAEEYAKDLGIPLEDSDVLMDGTGPEPKKERYGMSFNGLTNFIDTWLSSIHTDDDTKGEDGKKDMAYKLVHKIGEMNVDPEIFNDDSLYEAVLRDELQNLLGDITISDDEIQALKEDLIKKVLEAQHRAHDEIAGQTYKRNLRDTISNLLPDQRNLSKEEQATMERLKDQLADTYIDLHFSGGNENQRELLKRKITDEINHFCRDYLYRNPSSPLNSRTLNNNLYTALNKVPLPTGDSIRYEVEQARIRAKINDWIKELPLPPQNPTELLARNKLVYILSKKLFDIEVEGDDRENELMKKAIVKFLNKMPLESGENNYTLADKLIDKLKASAESRQYDASSSVTIDAFGNVSATSSGSGINSPICPAYKTLATPVSSGSPKVCRRPYPKQPKPFPPCTLSPEDRAHLERIKRRTCLSPSCVSSLMRNNKRDAGVGPRPVDVGSQTVLRPFGMEKQQNLICPVDNEKTPRPCPGLFAKLAHPPCSHARKDPFEIEKPPQSPICSASHEKTSRPCHPGPSRPSPQSGHQMTRHTISSSNIECHKGEVQPQVIIKQYYWNPNEKNSIVELDLQQSGRSSRRQSDPASCHQPGPAPCHQPGPAPCHQPGPAPCNQTGSATCDQTRTSSYAQSTPAPYHRPSLGNLQHQNTSPQRMPCDQSFTCPEPKSQHQPSPEHYSYCDPQRSFQRLSQRDIPSSRSSCTPSPCMRYGLNQQSSPPRFPGFSKRDHECQMPKRDGLQDQMPSNSRPCRKDRVIELGSSSNLPKARPKKRHSDKSDRPYTKFQEDHNFWGVPMRRVILNEGIDESVVMEREQREERIRCRCKERLIPKSGRSQPRTCPSQEIPQGKEGGQNLKRCSKCCGRHCPFPSFLYFRQ